MLAYGLPIMIAGIAFTINEVFDKILLSRLLPADIANSEAGKYAACYKLALFMTLFATAYRLGIEPFFFSHLKNKNPQKAYAQILYYFVLFGSVILLSVIVFLDYLKQIAILNPDYWEAMPVVPIVLLASFCLGIYHNLSVWYKVSDKTHIGAYISVFGALITIVVNFVFIPFYGYYASAIATLMAYGSMMIISFLLGRKHYYIPYDLKRIGAYFFSSIFLASVVFYGFSNDLKIGLPILSLFVVLLYIFERKTLKKHFLKA
jgi:O-antigen/teichoic acid export membrane protein